MTRGQDGDASVVLSRGGAQLGGTSAQGVAHAASRKQHFETSSASSSSGFSGVPQVQIIRLTGNSDTRSTSDSKNSFNSQFSVSSSSVSSSGSTVSSSSGPVVVAGQESSGVSSLSGDTQGAGSSVSGGAVPVSLGAVRLIPSQAINSQDSQQSFGSSVSRHSSSSSFSQVPPGFVASLPCVLSLQKSTAEVGSKLTPGQSSQIGAQKSGAAPVTFTGNHRFGGLLAGQRGLLGTQNRFAPVGTPIVTNRFNYTALFGTSSSSNGQSKGSVAFHSGSGAGTSGQRKGSVTFHSSSFKTQGKKTSDLPQPQVIPGVPIGSKVNPLTHSSVVVNHQPGNSQSHTSTTTETPSTISLLTPVAVSRSSDQKSTSNQQHSVQVHTDAGRRFSARTQQSTVAPQGIRFHKHRFSGDKSGFSSSSSSLPSRQHNPRRGGELGSHTTDQDVAVVLARPIYQSN